MLWLSTLGSSGLNVEVGPSALKEAGPGGVQITLGLYDGPLCVQFTAEEARRLVVELVQALDADETDDRR